MKFNYQYRTSGNELKRGVVSAADRDAAYAALVERGIRPSRLVEAPGLVNVLAGAARRWWPVAAIAVAAGAASAFLLRGASGGAASSMRHQIYGDPELMEHLESEGYASVFDDPGERYLACFAQPGVAATRLPGISPEALAATLRRKVKFSKDDSREVRELKAIVAGMKDELREYLSDGEGTVPLYMKRLEERLQEESSIYAKVARELEGENDEVVREAKNSALRAIGLRTVPKPRRRPPLISSQ